MLRTFVLAAVSLTLLFGGRPVWSQDTYAGRVPVHSVEEDEMGIGQEQKTDLVPLSTAAKLRPELRRHISVHLKEVSLEEALRRVAMQAGLLLSYGSETVEGTKGVTLERERIPVHKAFQILLRPTNLVLLVSPSGHLVVTDRSEAKRKSDVELGKRTPTLEPAPISSAELKTVQIQHTVSGTVTEAASGQPLPGVNIVIQGTSRGTATDASGQYSLTVPGPEAVLVFSLVGYQTREVEVGDRTTINVQLQEDVRLLEGVVITGYGSQRREEVTGSVSSVDVEQASTAQLTSPQEMIQGRLAGVSVAKNSGEPGAGIDISIRGVSSISAGTEPLYVIDGVPLNTTTITPSGASPGGVTASGTTNPLALLNPQDIESIDVLKDAAATAIYGSQGANGVVLIETKGGESGGARLDYSGKASVATIRDKMDMASGDRYRQARQELLGIEPTSDVSTDWQEETLRTAVIHEHNASLSGGNESTTYRTSLSYLDNQGILRNSGIERVTGRVNAQHSFTDWLRMNANLTGTYVKRNHLLFQQAGGAGGGVIKGMLSFGPTLPLRNDEGQFNEFARGTENPVALAERITDITDETRILGNVSMEVVQCQV